MLNNIMEEWIELTGVNPNQTSFKMVFGGHLSEWDIKKMNDRISNAIKTENGEMLAIVLFRMHLKEFLESKAMKLIDLVEHEEESLDLLEKARRLYKKIYSPEFDEVIQERMDFVKKGLRHYGMDENQIESITDENMIGELVYNVSFALNRLKTFQFSKGAPSTKTPKIYQNIYTFESVDVFLSWMMSVESGVALGLILGESEADNYFVFGVRNGGNLYLITDKPGYPHPLYARMSRSRSAARSFNERIMENYFPYELLDIRFDDTSRAYLMKTMEEGQKFHQFNNLSIESSIWLVLMYEVIEKKFFNEHLEMPLLSYTTTMMKTKNEPLFIETARNHEVQISSYPKLELTKLKLEDMERSKIIHNFGESHGFNDWLVEYFPDIDEKIFEVEKPLHDLLPSPKSNDFGFHPKPYKDAYEVMSMNFHTSEQLEKDRIFLARYNQAMYYTRMLRKEIDEKRNEVLKWVQECLEKRIDVLIEAIGKQKFTVSDGDSAIKRGNWYRMTDDGNILNISNINDDTGWDVNFRFSQFDEENHKHKCYISGSKPSYIARFHIRTAQQFAELCGVETMSLPRPLQNWTKSDKKECGNHILNNIDPMDWAVFNPWNGVNLDVQIYLSKREFNKLCKSQGTSKAITDGLA